MGMPLALRCAPMLATLIALGILPGTAAAAAQPFDAAQAQRFARLALACVHKEYPNKIAHVMSGDADARPPRELTPAFYGCYDWHSSVHGHWLLARLARRYPAEPWPGASPWRTSPPRCSTSRARAG